MSNQPLNSLKVRAPGPQSLIQDRGRTGFQDLGVSVSGAADMNALNIGNRLVGNGPGAAVVEIMFGGAEFEFAQSTVFALTGAEIEATLDDVTVAINVSYTGHRGARLKIGTVQPMRGMRVYLAVAGGIDTLEILGSRSTHVASGIGGLDEGRALAAGDVLAIGDSPDSGESGQYFQANGPATAGGPNPGTGEAVIRVVPGPQDDRFSEVGVQTFFESEYTVTDQSNRQGLRLDGPGIESLSGSYDIVSDAVVNGSVQVPGDGKPIILLADRQTTGGYAKIATVASVDLPLLGQTPPGTRIRFMAVSVAEAQQLLVEQAEYVLESELVHLVDPISVHVDAQHVSVGVAGIDKTGSGQVVRVAEINGVAYPVEIE